MKKLAGSVVQIILSIAIPIIFFLINSFVVEPNLSVNAIPLDETLAAEDFAVAFSDVFLKSVLVCIILNVLFVIAMVFLNMNSTAVWFIFLVLNMLVSCVFVYLFRVDYLTDTDTFVTTTLMFTLLNFVTYFISSIFTCSDYKHFNPVARFIRR